MFVCQTLMGSNQVQSLWFAAEIVSMKLGRLLRISSKSCYHLLSLTPRSTVEMPYFKSSLDPHRPAASASATPLQLVPSPKKTTVTRGDHSTTMWVSKLKLQTREFGWCCSLLGIGVHYRCVFLDKLTFSATGQIRLCDLCRNLATAYPEIVTKSQDLCKKAAISSNSASLPWLASRFSGSSPIHRCAVNGTQYIPTITVSQICCSLPWRELSFCWVPERKPASQLL